MVVNTIFYDISRYMYNAPTLSSSRKSTENFLAIIEFSQIILKVTKYVLKTIISSKIWRVYSQVPFLRHQIKRIEFYLNPVSQNIRFHG